MKESLYNIYSKTPKGTICHNTNADSYLLLSESLQSKISQQAFSSLSSNQLTLLKDAGIIVEDNIDEYELLISEFDTVKNSDYHEIVLMPTLDCNVRCWYCFETLQKGSRLSQDIQDAISKYVTNIFENKNVTHLNFQLFGGEPLLYFKEEVYPLLTTIKSFVDSINKKINFSFVTNGICIDESMLPLFKNLNATFQISIDGYRQKHNTIKKTSDGLSTYDKVIKAIHLLTSYYDAQISLRINYDNNTLKYIDEVISDLKDIDRKKINIHLERVWQTLDKKDQSEINIKDVIDKFIINGFDISYLNFRRRYYSCMVSRPNQTSINYNGDIYKCTGRDFSESLVFGKLQADGKIKWDNKKLDDYLKIDTYRLPMCTDCKLLPQCWGPCTQKQYENTDGRFEKYCQLKDMEMSMDDFILYRFNNEVAKL